VVPRFEFESPKLIEILLDREELRLARCHAIDCHQEIIIVLCYVLVNGKNLSQWHHRQHEGLDLSLFDDRTLLRAVRLSIEALCVLQCDDVSFRHQILKLFACLAESIFVVLFGVALVVETERFVD